MSTEEKTTQSRQQSADGKRQRPQPAKRGRSRKADTRTTLSEHKLIETTIKLLDDKGPGEVSLRSVARELNCGVASLYWYIENRDDLLTRAAKHIADDIVESFQADDSSLVAEIESRTAPFDGDSHTAPQTEKALKNIRHFLAYLFYFTQKHWWVAPQLSQGDPAYDGSFEMWEIIGRNLQETELDPSEQLAACRAIMSFAESSAASSAMMARIFPETEVDAPSVHDNWAELDPDDYAWTLSVIGGLEQHSHVDAFFGGIDYILRGIERQCNIKKKRK